MIFNWLIFKQAQRLSKTDQNSQNIMKSHQKRPKAGR